MGIKEYLARRRARRKGKVIDLPKYYKPSESGSMPGGTSGYVSTSDPSIPGAFEGYTSGGGGGGGGISTTTSSTSQLSTRTPTTSTTTTYKDIKLPTPSREIQTQQQIRAGETYDPRTGTYQTSTYGYGAGGTAIQRYPTYEERRRIQEAQEKGELGYQLTGYSQKDYEELKGSRDKISKISIELEKSSKEIEKTQERFESDWKGYIKNNEFVGTEKEYEVYKNSYNRLNKELVKYNKERIRLEGNIKRYEKVGGKISKEGYIEMPKVTIGGGKAGAIVSAYAFGGFGALTKDVGKYKGKDVSLEKFKGLYSPSLGVQASAGVSFLAKTGSQIVGERFGIALGREKKYVLAEEKLIPEKTLEGIYKPQFGTATEFDPLTGRAKAKYEDVTVKAHVRPQLYFTGEQLGQATGDILGGVGEGSKYLVPYTGGVFFASEVAERVKESGGAKQFIKEHPGEAALLGSVVLGGAAYAGAKYLKAPIAVKTAGKLRVTTRADKILGARVRLSKRGISLKPSERYLKEVTREVVKKPKVSFVEAGQKKIVDGKVIQKSYPIIVEEPAIVKETTLFSKLGKKRFGEKVSKIVEIKYKQPKITSPFADKPIIAGKPFVLRTQRLGKTGKLGEPKYTFVNQEGKFVPVEDISKLSKVEQYALLKTVEKGKLGGAPIKQKEILKFLKEEEQIQLGISKELVLTKPVGKTTAQFQKAAIVKEVKPIGDVKVYDVMVGSKDISKTYPRAVGDVGLIKGKYLEFPQIDKTTSDVTTIISSSGKGTPLSSTFELQKVQALKYIPKKPTPTKLLKPTMEVKPTQVELPLMVGGTGLKEIPYARTGLYETQEQVGVSAIKLDGITQPSFVEMKQQEIQVSAPISKLKSIQTLKPESMLKETTILKQEPILKIKQQLKQELLLKQALKTKQQLKQESLFRQAQLLKQRQALKIETPVPFKPVFKLGDAIKKVTKMAKEKPQEFEVFGRRFGKEVKLGKAKTKTKAEEKLGKFLTKTLGAAGFVTKEGKKLKASEIELLKKKGFRKSKLSEFLVIERKEKRLRKAGTGKEIQFFRKTPKKGRKSRGLFGI